MHPLISTQALADRIAQGDGPGRLRVFDTTVHLRPADPGPFRVESGRADYLGAHVPGAAFIDLQDELSDVNSPLRFTLPGVAPLEAAFSAAGLSDADDCVLYSSTSPMWATRVWWMLRSLGFAARVLDGGLPKWKAEGRPLATGEHRFPAGRFSAAPVAGLWADRDAVRQAIGNGAVCTLNALTASAHAGTSPVSYGRKGRIRGSVNVPYPALLTEDGSLRPVADLRQAFDAVGALHSPRVICYCGGGIAATLDALALQLAGQPHVAVYDGSLSEWAGDPDLPMDSDA